MSRRNKKQSLLGGLLHHLCGWLLLALVLLLPCQLAFYWFLKNDAKIVLPDFILEKISGELAGIGIKADFDEINIRASGRVEVNQLRFAQPGHADVLFSARRIVVDFNPADLLFQKIDPRRIFIDDGNLYCPASTSPTGKRDSVITDIRASVAREGGWLIVETLQAKLDDMPIVAYGNLVQPALGASDKSDAGEDPRKMIRETWRNLAQTAPKIMRVRDELRAAGAVALEVEAKGESSGAVMLSVASHGAKFLLPGNVVARDAKLTFSLLFDGIDFKPGRDSRLTVGSAEWHDAETGLDVKTGSLRFASRFGEKWERPTTGYFSACDIEINGERIDYARGFANWKNFPAITAGAFIVKSEDLVSVNAAGDWKQQTLAATYRARLSPAKYLADEKIKKLLPAELNALSFPSHPEIAGNITFSPGLKFNEAKFELRTGKVQFREFKMNRVEADVRITPEKLEVFNADLRADDYRAQGDFSTGFKNDSEYRFLLHGSTHPHLLNGIIGDWWPELWKDFRLDPKNLPRVDIEIHGQWEGRPDEFIFCGAVGENINFRGERIDKAELRITELPDLFALFDMRAAQNGLFATGSLQWHYALEPTYRRHSLRMQFDGTLPKNTAAALAGEGLPETLAPIITEKPATVAVIGYYSLAASAQPGREQVVVRANVPGKITAWNLPLSDFTGTVAYDSRRLAIEIERANFGGGQIISSLETDALIKEKNKPKHFVYRGEPSRAWVDLRPDKPTLTMDAEIMNAKRSAFFDDLGKLKGDATAGGKIETPPAPAIDPFKQASLTPPDNSSMDIRFSGKMSLPDLDTLRGTGMAYTYDPGIPRLHLFGGLSRVIERMGFGLGSFKLDHAQSNFTIQKGKIYFPHIVISGSNSEINASGNYTIKDETINMRAILTSDIGGKIPVIGHVLDVLNRIPRLMPVNVTGTLENPEWSMDPTPSAILESSFNEKLGTPPPE